MNELLSPILPLYLMSTLSPSKPRQGKVEWQLSLNFFAQSLANVAGWPVERRQASKCITLKTRKFDLQNLGIFYIIMTFQKVRHKQHTMVVAGDFSQELSQYILNFHHTEKKRFPWNVSSKWLDLLLSPEGAPENGEVNEADSTKTKNFKETQFIE